MIHVKRVAGQASSSLRSTASAWQVSPMAESRRMQTVAGGECCNVLRNDMRLERIATATGAILYDPSRIDHPADRDFEPVPPGRSGSIERAAAGRGSAWFVTARGASGGEWLLKHYRRGGFVARVVADRYLWAGEAATRSFHELTLLAALEDRALPAARPVAARYRRAGLTYRADLLSVAIPGARSLASLLGPALTPSGWRRVGECLRAFHDAGAFHADLNAHNVLIDAGGSVQLIDFDRGALRAPGEWRSRTLARLERSLVKLAAGDAARWGDTQRAALYAGYGAPRASRRR
jgi:3-deoxy-D-manno-octulosonic acid kinase